jgi:hypothetical protein
LFAGKGGGCPRPLSIPTTGSGPTTREGMRQGGCSSPVARTRWLSNLHSHVLVTRPRARPPAEEGPQNTMPRSKGCRDPATGATRMLQLPCRSKDKDSLAVYL